MIIKNIYTTLKNPYLVTIVLISFGAILRIWPLNILEGRVAWLTFYPVVICAALYGGIYAGLLGASLSCIMILFVLPLFVDKPFIQSYVDWLGMVFFFLTCIMISLITESMRREKKKVKHANEKIIKLNEELESRVHERTSELLLTNENLRNEITERKKAEVELRESEEFNKSLFQTIPFEMNIVDEEGIIIFQNEKFKKQFGEKAIGKHCWELYRDDKIRCYNCPLISGIKIGESVIFESGGILGGRIFNIIHSGIILQGKKAVLEIFIDITELKQAEAEILKLNAELEQRIIERTAQLEATNKELEAFSYSISHDLRTPLRHITGYTELIQKQFSNILDGDAVEYFNVISSSAKNMGVLIDDLLNFSRIGRKDITKKDVNTYSMVNEIITLGKEFTDRKIEWNVGVLSNMFVDQHLIRQVWINLLSNAIKYTSTREVAVINIQSREEDKEFIYSVSDNGVGFNMKYVDKLFGVFQRLHKAKDFEGTGIGLAIVRNIVTRHGGRTWAEGEIDKGATFYFSLPKNN